MLHTRREWMKASVAAIAAMRMSGAAPQAPVTYFSKHLHWLSVEQAVAYIKELGFDGVDLTVRDKGHVLPENVQRDLPAAVRAAKQAGTTISMITTDIRDLSTPHAREILQTAAEQGIRVYRWNNFAWQKEGNLPDQLEALKPKVAALAELNRKLGMTAVYHNHSGEGRVGEGIWDLWYLLRDHSPEQVAINLDIAHATVEGGLGGWKHTLRLMRPYVKGACFKDFRWEKNAQGRWAVRWSPLGTGMAPIKEYGSYLREIGFRGPIQLHTEYAEMGSAASGSTKLDLPREQVESLIRKDLSVLRGVLDGAS